MTHATPDRDPLTTAQGLTAALKGMSARLDKVSAQGQSTRRIAWGLVVSVALDVALTVILALIAVQAHDASNSANAASMRASHASASNLALCRASNVARAQQVGLWEYLLHLGAPPKTEQGRELIAKFEHHLLVVFAPRNCVKLGTRKP